MALALAASVLGTVPLGGSTPTIPTSTPGFVNYAAPDTLTYASSAGEPSIGVSWPTGSVFLQSFTQTFRARFDDSVSPPSALWDNVGKGAQTVINVDPILFTDSATGRTYAGGLDGECSILGVTEDDGATWQPMGNACASPSFDHQTIGAGPWSSLGVQRPRLHDQAVYYCAQTSIAQCAVSSDGGLTFGPAVPVACGVQNPGLHGSVHVGPDGYAYLPFKRCGGVSGVAVSPNSGITWTSRPIPGATSAPAGFDPDVATTPSGWAWVGYPRSDFGVGAALTKDHGATWTNFGDVAASAGVMSSTFHEMVAGDDGRAAVVYLGSTTDGNPFNAAFAGVWHVYATYTFDAGLTWETVQVTTDPVQRGWICAGGVGCGSGRNLLDFIDATVDAEGRVLVGYADGCIAACAASTGTAAQSTAAYATIARQTCGRSLFAATPHVNGGAACPTVGGAAPPVSISGAYYATGTTPNNNVDGVAAAAQPGLGATLTPVAPTSPAPKAVGNGAGQWGTNAGTIYDAHWFLPAPSNGLKIDNKDVTVRLWVTAAGAGNLRVALYDAHATSFATTANHLREAIVPVPASPVPVEVVVTFSGVDVLLGQGLELYVNGPATGEVVILYDSVSTPTRLEIA